MAWVADYSLARPGGATLKAAGASGVMRYGGDYRFDGAVITKPEYDDLVGHGLAVGIVLEYTANWMMAGYAYCKQMGLAARALEDRLGIPRGVTYGAVDWDITLGGAPQSAQALDNCKRTLDGFHGLADAYGGWEFVRPYGSKWFAEWACANSPMSGSWSTQAWSRIPGQGSVPATNAALFQYAGWPAGVPYVAGCDFNLVRGNWAPRTAPMPGPVPQPPTPTPGDDVVAGFQTIDLNRALDFNAAPLRVLRGMLSAWAIHVDGVAITALDPNSHRTREGVRIFQEGIMRQHPATLKVDTKTWRALTDALTK